jgi:hypothetical protein
MTLRTPCLLALLLAAGGCERTSLGSSRSDAGTRVQDGLSAVDVMPASQPPSGGQCPDGYAPCGSGDGLRCYDLGRSSDHCGACGNACATGIGCQAGTCEQHRCKGALSFKTLVFDSIGFASTLGDFDGDGILDLVGSTEGGGPLTLLYGAGDGTFSNGQIIESTPMMRWQTWQARAADLDRDGFMDLITIDGSTSAFAMATDGSVTASVSVRRGSGNRGAPFGEPTRYPTTSAVLSGLLLADLDADGRLDLVVGATNSGLEYWRGLADARFEHQAPFASREVLLDQPGPPQAMDWNGDGILDLVYASFGFGGYGAPAIGGGGNLLFRLGLGGGRFDAEVSCALLPGLVGDLDNDHRPDLLSGPSILLGIDGCRASTVTRLVDWPKQGGIAMADFNGDGNQDVVADDNIGIMVGVGDGKGGFPHTLTIPVPTQGQWPLGVFLMGDVNRDGKLDVVFARDGENGWGVLLNTCP